jgi:Uma2 family endonuclease
LTSTASEKFLDWVKSLSKKYGTKLGYFIDLDDELIRVFQPNQLPEVLGKQDILPVLDVLGNWNLTVADVFS